MNTISRRISTLLIAALLSTIGAITFAAPSSAAVCGWTPLATDGLGGGSDDGNVQKGVYNHCGSTNVEIRVQYHYASRDMCVTPGETILWANPNLGALQNAYYIGLC